MKLSDIFGGADKATVAQARANAAMLLTAAAKRQAREAAAERRQAEISARLSKNA